MSRSGGRSSASSTLSILGFLLLAGAGRGALDAAESLIAVGDTWKYFRGTTAPSNPLPAWREKDFDDSTWEDGPTGIGYGDGDDATQLTDMMNSYVAVFARRAFTVPDPAAIRALTLSIDFDDGFVAYLNGSEVARRNMGNPGEEFDIGRVATALRESGSTVRFNLSPSLGSLTAGRNVLAIEVRNNALNSSDLSLIPSLVANDTAGILVEAGEDWKYFRGRAAPSEPPTAWRDPGFDDSSWEVGPTGIGYGDGDDATTLADMQNGYASVFARKEFQVVDPASINTLFLVIDFDDGFIAYLNGQEVSRQNSGALGEELAFDRLATAAHEAGTPLRVNLSGSIDLVVAGRNVLAVEARNNLLDSTDLSMIPSLISNDDALTCPSALACAAQGAEVALTWSNNRPDYNRIEITRNGVPLAGSPFAGTAASARDTPPAELDAVYQLVAFQGGVPCAAISCTSTLQARGQGTLQCALSLVDGTTQGSLTWTDIPGTVNAEIRREGVLLATVPAGQGQYLDLDVESAMPEQDTEYEVRLIDGNGRTATMSCGAALSLCPTLACGVADVGGTDRVQLTFGNLVKEWESFTLQRPQGGPVTLPGTATGYLDETFLPEPGVNYAYTLQPVALPGEQVACDQTCTFSAPAPEIAAYDPPAGGWDYSIDFEAHPGTPMTRYASLNGETGNLDGRWIRAVDRDFWDGSTPDEIGAPPDGPAPGGIQVVERPGLGPCGETVKALRIHDAGDPSDPVGTSLAAAHPDAYLDPSNKAIFLGLDTGVAGQNLLRTGVTFAARWRVAPDVPAYMNAPPTGDGEPLVGGALGSIGFHFRNLLGAIPAEGPPVSASFALNSGDTLLFSADDDIGGPFSLSTASITTFRSLWVTVEDPEGDNSYRVTAYTNGRTTPFLFSSGEALLLEEDEFDFGAAAGNYLAIGLADIANDSVIEIDSIAYKEGVHPPAVRACAPCENTRPNARIAVTPPTGQVELSADSRAEVTLNGGVSDDGDGGAQGLAYSWIKVSGPAGDVMASPAAAVNRVTFISPGLYGYRLTVNDGQRCNGASSAQTNITVLPRSGGGADFRRGDADGNGNIELTDAVKLLNYLFLGQAKPECLDAADTDDSGEADISDAIANLNYQFQGSIAPAAPGPLNCGKDPNDEAPELGCDQGGC